MLAMMPPGKSRRGLPKSRHMDNIREEKRELGAKETGTKERRSWRARHATRGGPGGINPYYFQRKNQSALFALFRNSVSLTWKRCGLRICPGMWSPVHHFALSTFIRNVMISLPEGKMVDGESFPLIATTPVKFLQYYLRL